jgi:hypothetical protein
LLGLLTPYSVLFGLLHFLRCRPDVWMGGLGGFGRHPLPVMIQHEEPQRRRKVAVASLIERANKIREIYTVLASDPFQDPKSHPLN